MAENCKNCGYKLEDDAVFCSNCGVRVDGKITCKNCGKSVSQDAIYCTYCGARVDGKVFCPTCNIEVEGTFCPQCGKKVKNSAKSVAINGYNAAELDVDDKTDSRTGGNAFQTFKSVVKIVSPALLILSMVLLFALSFAIGVRVNVSGRIGGEVEDIVNLQKVNKGGIFYYFGDVYRDLKGVYGNKLSFTEVLPAVVITLMLAVNLIVSLIMLIVSTVKFIKAVCAKKGVNLLPYFGWSFATFWIASLTIIGMVGLGFEYYENYDSISISIALNTSVKAGLIISAVLSIISIALICVAKGKKFLAFAPFGKVLFFAVAGVFVTVAVSFACGYEFIYTAYSEVTRISLSSGALIAFMQDYITSFADISASKFVYTPYVLSYVAYIGLAISAGALLATLYGSLIKKKGVSGVITTTVITACFAIFYLIAAISVKSDLDSIIADNKLSVSIVRAVVTSVLAIISAGLGITGAIIGSSARQEKQITE